MTSNHSLRRQLNRNKNILNNHQLKIIKGNESQKIKKNKNKTKHKNNAIKNTIDINSKTQKQTN